MIRAGRTVIDRWGIAALHGMTESVARRHRPWAAPGHPPPVTSGRGAAGGRAVELWDHEQAAAFAAGRPVPPLPSEPSPEDLLDAHEAATEAGVAPKTYSEQVRDGYLPGPDAVPYGVPHVYRRTLIDALASRPGRGSGGGRRRRDPVTGRTHEHERVRAVLVETSSESLTVAEIAARAGVTEPTARKYRNLEREHGDA